MKIVAVLGSGLVGGLIIRDLLDDPEIRVRATDLSDSALSALPDSDRLERRKVDLSDTSAIRETVADVDVVVGAVPGRFGNAMLRAVIESGKPIADISFSPEDPLDLDDLARSKGVAAVMDCGVSPGLSNLAVGRAASRLDSIESAIIYVGGLPVERYWPYEYRVVFSATDVIEEYTRPARLVEEGRLVTREALSEVELIDMPGLGTVEAFNTDGLRTLIRTIKARNMREKTLRYPGHADRMRMLRETGFFSEKPVRVGAVEVGPRALTEELLFRTWKRPPDEPEVTALHVAVSGLRDGTAARFEYDLVDRTDSRTGATSMARTTGYPCAIVARMLTRGIIRATGVLPLELLAPDTGFYEALISDLQNRGIHFRESVFGP